MAILKAINSVLWHNYVLYSVLGTGVLFTFWSGFSQYHALTHGVQVIRGKYDNTKDPGAITHFQALSAALSATVGLGNIGGVALAIALGGPGAVFWMWMVALFGMALKTTEVTLALLYRNTEDKDNPYGGPMWVAREGLRQRGFGTLGAVFCVTVIISAITGGNMFQAWNVAEITHAYFPGIPKLPIGVLLALLVGTVIIGGIKRIGAVASKLVPFMCVLYLVAALYVILANLTAVPEMLRLIVVSAFLPTEATGAFLGGTAGYAFLWGMKRALFSSEAGQGSAPIVHAAAKTDEPVREGIVAGLEPFIDTLVVCTLTTLVILLSGAWNREAEAHYANRPDLVNAQHLMVVEHGRRVETYGQVIGQDRESVAFLQGSAGVGEAVFKRFSRDDIVVLEPAGNSWIPAVHTIPAKSGEARRVTGDWKPGDTVFMVIHGELDPNTGRDRHRLPGTCM